MAGEHRALTLVVLALVVAVLVVAVLSWLAVRTPRMEPVSVPSVSAA